MSHKNEDKTVKNAVLTRFLNLLDDDTMQNPPNITLLPHSLLERALDLTKDVEINLDQPINEEND